MSRMGGCLVLVASLPLTVGLLAWGGAPAADQKPVLDAKKSTRTDRYGDPIPPSAITRMGTTRLRHQNLVSSIAFAPNGQTLVTGSFDGTIRLWEVSSGKELLRLQGHDSKYVYSVAYSPDGTILATGGADNTIRLWSLPAGKLLDTFQGHGGDTTCVRFSPNGKTLATCGSDQIVRVWDISAGKQLSSLSGHETSIYSLAFSPDGTSLATGGKCTQLATRPVQIIVWDLRTGQKVRNLSWHDSQVWALAFSPDGKHLAAAGDDSVVLWEVKPAKRLFVRKPAGRGVAFSSDGKSLAVGGLDRVLRILSIPSGDDVHRLEGHGSSVNCVAFSPDGCTVASTDGKSIRLWNSNTEKALLPLAEGHKHYVHSIACSPDGKLLVTGGGDNTVRLWELPSGKELRCHYLPWDEQDRFNYARRFVNSVALSRDGTSMAAAGNDGFVRVWHVSTGKQLLDLKAHQYYASVVQFTPDSKRMVTGGGDSTICVYEVISGREVRKIKTSSATSAGVLALAIAPDGKTVASSSSLSASVPPHSIHLWDIDTGKSLDTVLTGPDVIKCIEFSPDGRMLVSLGKQERRIHLCKLEPRLHITTLENRPGVTLSIALSPDGKTLASAEEDGVIRLWEICTRRQIRSLRGHEGCVYCLKWLPGGRFLASGAGDGTVLLWDTSSPGSVENGRPSGMTNEDLERLWLDLGSNQPDRAYDAIWALSAAKDKAIPMLKERLQPIKKLDEKRVHELITDLNDDRFVTRENATRELMRFGPLIERDLHRALASRSQLPEVRSRIESLLEMIPAMLATSEQLRQVRAVQVLEKIGSPQAQQLLESLADGESRASLTQDTRAAVERLQGRALRQHSP